MAFFDGYPVVDGSLFLGTDARVSNAGKPSMCTRMLISLQHLESYWRYLRLLMFTMHTTVCRGGRAARDGSHSGAQRRHCGQQGTRTGSTWGAVTLSSACASLA